MNKITFVNANVLVGNRNMSLLENANIEVTDETITNIGDFKIDKNSKIIDLNGKYLLPGLINLHVHLPSSGKLSKKKLGDKTKIVNFVKNTKLGNKIGILICKKYAQTALNSGVTTLRAVGGVGDIDSKLRDLINSGDILGPRLLVCNTAIGVKGGHMDGTVAKAIDSNKEIKARIQELKRQNVDLIKLMITGGVLDGKEPGHPAQLRMEYDLVKECCDFAHSLGLKVAAHVESKEGMDVAIKAGVDSIEHGSVFDESLVKLMLENKQAVVTTLSPAIPFIDLKPEQHGYGEVALINSKIVLDGMIEGCKKCLENNIPVGLGTDAGSTLTSHYNFYKELILFTRLIENNPRLALYLATLGNATIAGIDNETGSIEINKKADLIVVDENPLINLNTLGKVKMVMIKGHLIQKPKVKHDKALDALVDSII